MAVHVPVCISGDFQILKTTPIPKGRGKGIRGGGKIPAIRGRATFVAVAAFEDLLCVCRCSVNPDLAGAGAAALPWLI